MAVPLLQIDSFTNRPFAGNPAAVCLLEAPRDERWMQNVALEMNLSETAFLVPQPDGYDLRWFTPTVEVALCGHATLASAHALWETGRLAPHLQARFHTRSGLLTADRNGEWIEMDFPVTPNQPEQPPPGLTEALGAEALYIGRNKFDYLVEVASEEMVRGLQPNFHVLRKLPVRGVIVTARASTNGYDFVSRFFAPGSGVDEDPVTGSAHCALGPFWSSRLHKTELIAYQASPRGGVVRVIMKGDRLLLCGQAVTIFRTELEA